MFLWAGVLAERLDCEALSTTERRTGTARFGLPGLWGSFGASATLLPQNMVLFPS